MLGQVELAVPVMVRAMFCRPARMVPAWREDYYGCEIVLPLDCPQP